MQLFTDQEIKDILDKDLLELMGVKNMSEEKRAELYQKMAQTVQDRVVARIDDRLNKEGRAEFIKLIDEGDKVKTEEYLKAKNIDVAKLLVEEAIIYKTQMMTLLKQKS